MFVAVIRSFEGKLYKTARSSTMGALPETTTVRNLGTYISNWPQHQARYIAFGTSRSSRPKLAVEDGVLKTRTAVNLTTRSLSTAAAVPLPCQQEEQPPYAVSQSQPEGSSKRKKVSTLELKRKHKLNKKITMVTAYDHPSGVLADEAGFDLVLVGDSVGMVVLGHKSTIPVTLSDMVHHTAAVSRGVSSSLVVGDMPFGSYNNESEAVANAMRLLKEGGADAIKLEGGERVGSIARALTQAGIAVMGHVGLTPQSHITLGGYRCQGRSKQQQLQIKNDVRALEEAGCFAIVAECVPDELAAELSAESSVPIIGIGSGNKTHGQVLVWHDILGLSPHAPKFSKRFADVRGIVLGALGQYKSDVEKGEFPARQHTTYLTKKQPASETAKEETRDCGGVSTGAVADAGVNLKTVKVGVVGGGALGSLLAASLARCLESVVLVSDWRAHADTINEHGLSIVENCGATRVYKEVRVISEDQIASDESSMDFVFVCVKSNKTGEGASVARRMVEKNKNGVIVTLQNGWNVDTLRAICGDRSIVCGTTCHGAWMGSEGTVYHRGVGQTAVAPANKSAVGQSVALVADLLNHSGITTTVESDSTRMIWKKLLINSSINPIAAMIGVKNGVLGEVSATRQLVSRVADEVNAVYRQAHGNKTTNLSDKPSQDVMQVVNGTGENVCSMLGDVQAARQTEVDAILGHVIRTGRECGVPTPTCDILQVLVEAIDQTRGKRVGPTLSKNQVPAVKESENGAKKLVVLRSRSEMRKWREEQAKQGAKVGFVPTMGCLHQGHIDLVRAAARECDQVVVSIFVNPTQFAAHEDLDQYPRTMEADLAKLNAENVQVVFAPTASEMYPNKDNALGQVMVNPIGFEALTAEGLGRPHFFQGVATVCTKLFCAVQPTAVFFGQKDFVQTVVIKRLVQELMMAIDVVVCDTTREHDGVAMSSRNVYLSEAQRQAAPVIYKSLCAAKELVGDAHRNNRSVTADEIKTLVTDTLLQESLVGDVEYVSVADNDTASESNLVGVGEKVCVSVAVKMNGGQSVRLIDNMVM